VVATISAAGQDYIVYVASSSKESKGIYAFRFDSSSGKLDAIGPVGEAPGASFLALHPSRRWLYAVSGANGGTVSAFRIDPKSAQLTLLNSVSSKGAGPCYVRVDQSGKNAMIANYGGGSVAVLPIEPDGKLREASSFIQQFRIPILELRNRPDPKLPKIFGNTFSYARDLLKFSEDDGFGGHWIFDFMIFDLLIVSAFSENCKPTTDN